MSPLAAGPGRWGGGPPGAGGGLDFRAAAPWTRRLLVLNLVIFGASFLADFYLESAWIRFEELFGLTPALWRRWFPLPPLWQLVSYGFLHSTRDAFHVLFNMLLLYSFGRMLEGMIGSRRFLVVYLGSMVAGALVFLAIGLVAGSQVNAIGASGAVLGALVACATLRPNAEVYLLFFPIRLRTVAIAIVLLDLMGAMTQHKLGTGGVAYSIHLAGGAFGFLSIRAAWVDLDPLAWWRGQRARRTAERRRIEERELDRLLERIARDGIGSLSERERAFLKRASQRR